MASDDKTMMNPRKEIERRAKGAAGDLAVMMTCDDAAVSKLAAVSKGYYPDPFIQHFVSKPVNRAPLINRGHYCRVSQVRSLLSQFLETSATRRSEAGGEDGSQGYEQIVNLGAGMDSTFFYLKSVGAAPRGGFFEVDLPAVVAAKTHAILRAPSLRALLDIEGEGGGSGDGEGGRAGVKGKGYALVEADLRDPKTVEAALVGAGLDLSAPTLLLSECVIIYMPADMGTALISWAAAAFSTAAFVTYEQVYPHDAFGSTMVKNIAARGCPLQAILNFPDCAAQEGRYKQAGWTGCECITMSKLFDTYTPEDEKTRISRVEIFDEVEEWNLIQGHYCMVCATLDKQDTGFWKDFSPTRYAAPLERLSTTKRDETEQA